MHDELTVTVYVLLLSSTAPVQPVHEDVIHRFFSVQYLLLSPICPHFCDYVRCNLMGGDANAVPRWPALSGPIDHALLAQDKYLQVRARLCFCVCVAIMLHTIS